MDSKPYRTIELTQGQVALVDAEDYDRINKWNWCAIWKSNTFYACAHGHCNDTRNSLAMARLVMNVSDRKIYVDHRNHQTLDNRKENLRLCTNAQNVQHHRLGKRNKSGYAGVLWLESKKRWEVRITVNYKTTHLGYYENKEEAISVRLNAEKKLFGEFACQLGKAYVGTGPTKYPSIQRKRKRATPSASLCNGVTFHKTTKRWYARSTINGKRTCLGIYKTEIEAIACMQKHNNKEKNNE